MKRFLAILLVIAMLPIPATFAREAAAPAVIPESAFDAVTADVWDDIEAIEEARVVAKRGKNATADDYAAIVEDVIAIVEDSDTFVEGSIVRNGSFFSWRTTEGVACGYSPRLRAQMHATAIEGADPEDYAAAETVSFAEKGGVPASKNVAVFQPYYGIDSSFKTTYSTEGTEIAQAMGGTSTTYKTTAATIDQIADSFETCGVVIFDSHGDTDYYNPSNDNDFVSKANTSYLCLHSGTGITNADMADVTGTYSTYQHAYYAGASGSMKVYCVDGTAIANHMEGTSPNGLLWSAICLGMATNGLHAPLRAKGVEVAYGYSQSVSFTYDYKWEAEFWDKMIAGNDVAASIAAMKSKVGNWDYPSSYSTITIARNNYAAFPIVVSSEDTYPGKGNVDNLQTVNSTWKLKESTTPTEPTTAPTEPTTAPGSGEYSLTTSLKDGDQVIIYNASAGKAMSEDAVSTNYRAGADVTVSNNKIVTDDSKIVWTVKEATGGYMFLNDDGEMLSANKGLNYASTDNVWAINPAKTANSVYIVSTTATGTSGDPKTIEWYDRYTEFSTYYYSEASEAIFAMQLFSKGGSVTPTEPTTAPTEPTSAPTEPTTAPTEPITPPSGSVAIYYPKTSKVMTTESYLYNNKKYEMVAADATLSGGKLTTSATNVALFEMITEDGITTFKTADGKYLEADGTNVQLVSAQNDNTKFVLEANGSDYFIKCANATYNGNPQYIEVYGGYFTVYSKSASADASIYTFNFYPLDGGTTPTEPTTAPTEPTSAPTEPTTAPTEPIGDEAFVLADSIQVGDKIAFVAAYNGKYYAMTNDTSTNNALGAKEVTVTNDSVDVSTRAAGSEAVWEVAAGSKSGAYLLKSSDGKYISYGDTGTALKLADAGTNFSATCGKGVSRLMGIDSSDADRGISFRQPSGGVPQFRLYKTSNNSGEYSQELTIFKRTGSTTPTEPTTAPTEPTTAPTEPTTAPTEPTTAPDGSFVLSSSIKDGDQVVIYNPGHGMAIKDENTNHWYLVPQAVTPVDNKIASPDAAIVWTVVDNGNGTYSFVNGSDRIVCWVSGNYFELTNDPTHDGADGSWKVSWTDGLAYIQHATFSNSYGPAYIECYYNASKDVTNVSGYSSSDPTAKPTDFGWQFYVKSGSVTPTEPTTAPTEPTTAPTEPTTAPTEPITPPDVEWPGVATGYTSADDVEYVTDGTYIANWGARAELCTFLPTYAQNYYTGSYTFEALSGKTGGTTQSNVTSSQLYSALKSMLKAKQTHETSYNETRDLYCYTDCVNSNYSYISSFYSGMKLNGAWGTGWNREHTWPNSKGNDNQDNDIMMLRPTSNEENSDRGNLAYGESSGFYDPNKESNSELNLHGDVARIMLYCYVRWENQSYMWGASGVMENMDVLLRWMEEDPVDTWEMGRNDAVQSITGVRNVFVDYPEYAWLLFSRDVPAGYVTPSGSTGPVTPTEPTTAPTEPTEAPTEPTSAPTEPTTAPGGDVYVLTNALKDGDEVIIYNASANKAMSEDAVSTNYRAGADVTVSGNKIVTSDSKIVWKVAASGDGFTFANDAGETLSATKGLSFASTDNVWVVNEANTADSVYIVSTTASGASGDPKFVEWYDKYSEFSTYYYSESNERIFAMQLFVKGGAVAPTEPTTAPTEPTTAPTQPTEPIGEAFVLADSIQVGDKIVFAAEYNGKNYAMTNDTSINNALGAEEVTVNGNTVEVSLSRAAGSEAVWEVTAGSAAGTYCLKSSDGRYITWASGTTIKLSDTGADFNVTCGKGTSAILLAADASRALFLRDNGGALQFRAYATSNATSSGYSAVLTIFKHNGLAPTEPTEAPTEPTEAPTEPTAEPTTAPTEPTTAPTEPTTAPTEPTTAPGGNEYVLTTSLKDGDEVIIYNASAGKAMSEDAVSDIYRAGADVTVSGNKIVTDDSKIVWKVTASGSGYTFANDAGETLSATKGLSFASTDNVWAINAAATANSVYIVSTTATGTQGDPKYVEWFDKYSEFSTYYYSTANDGIFLMQLFVRSSSVTPTEPTTAPTEPTTAPTEPTTAPTEPTTAPGGLPFADGDCVVMYNAANGVIIGYEEDTDYDESTGNYTYINVTTEAVSVSGTTLTADFENAGTFYAIINDDGTVYFLDQYDYDQSEDPENPDCYFLAASAPDTYYDSYTDYAAFELIPVEGGYLMKNVADDSYYAVENGVIVAKSLIEGDPSFIFQFAIWEGESDSNNNIICTLVDGGTAPTEPTTAPTEPTTAPTEPTTAPTEPTTAPTEPTTAPTEPTTAPTEPTTAPTEPTTAPTEPTTAPTEPTTAPAGNEYVLTTSLEDGDEVIIYNATAGKAMSEDAIPTNNNYRAGVDVTVSGNKIVTDDSKIVWKVTKTEDGYIFTNDAGESLSATKGLSFAESDNVWRLDAASTADSVYIVSTTATGNSGDPKYIEWYDKYSEFSTYYYSANTDEIFVMQLFVRSSSVTPTEPTTAPTEPTTAPTEPTTAPTEPTTAPTEPTTAPTEPTTAPTEPTTAPTEPTEPFDGAVIRVGSVQAEPGAMVTVPVTISANPGFAGFTLTVDAAEGLTLQSIKKGELLSAAEGMFTPNVATSSVNWTASENVYGDGELMLLTFTVSNDESGSYAITLARKDDKATNFANENEAAVPVAFLTGKVTVGGTAPTEPTTAPTEPTTAPTEPTTAPTEPTTAPTEPSELPSEFKITIKSSNEEYGKVSIMGNVVTGTPNNGYRAATYEIVPWDAADVKQEGNLFYLTNVTKDFTLTVIFVAKEAAELRFKVPAGCIAKPISTWIDEPTALKEPTGELRADMHDYEFIGWTKEAIKDETEAPDYYTDTFTPETALTTLHALYRYEYRGEIYFTTVLQMKTCLAKEFDDVDVKAWYHEALDFVLEYEYMKGVGYNSKGELFFEPEGKLTRAMMVTILYRLDEREGRYSHPFNDVPTGAWYAKAVAWAYDTGVVNGTSKTTFTPNEPITREQTAAMLYRYARWSGEDVTPKGSLMNFVDANKVSEFARDPMRWAVGEGIINGKGKIENKNINSDKKDEPTDILDPLGTATRAEIAQILYGWLS